MFIRLLLIYFATCNHIVSRILSGYAGSCGAPVESSPTDPEASLCIPLNPGASTVPNMPRVFADQARQKTGAESFGIRAGGSAAKSPAFSRATSSSTLQTKSICAYAITGMQCDTELVPSFELHLL